MNEETIGKKVTKVKSNKKKLVWLLLLVLFSVVVVLYHLGYLTFPWQNRNPVPIVAGDVFPGAGMAEDGFLSGMSEQEIHDEMQRIADASQFSFKINAAPIFENGKSEGDIRIENPKYNIYPMVVQIVLDETGEIIYDSGGIMPNQHIENGRLVKQLKQGTHQATANFYAYDPDSLIAQGQSAVKLTLTIKN
jgi:hypothetical protein